MNTVPDKIGDANTILYLIINLTHIKTGNTKHWVNGNAFHEFYGLAICKYEDCESYCLFYCDNNWNVITDTNHETVEDAKDQAEFEFISTIKDWIDKV